MNSRKEMSIWLAVFVFISALLLTLAVPAAGRTIYVDPNGSADFTSIQAAIDDPYTVNDDEIEVAPWIYVGAINFNGKAITLRSTDPNDPSVVDNTIIHGGMASSAVTCNHGEGPDTVLAGFTIMLGYAVSGGGMYNLASSPTVRNCTFTNNYATSFGGGMYNMTSSPTVINCTFSSNSGGTIGGGGMCNWAYSSPTVTNCTFNGNTSSQDGGGMYNYSSSPTVTNCNFSENSATQYGGGMYCENSSPTVTDCNFSGNSASGDVGGGGMFNEHCGPTVENCTFTDNTASGTYGGGGMSNNYSNPTVTNCFFQVNSSTANGGGIYNNYCDDYGSNPNFVNCTFTGNTATGGTYGGGGMFNFRSSPTLTNCIFSHNSAPAAGGGGIYNRTECAPTLTNCIFSHNSATSSGGGIYNRTNCVPMLTNCTFTGNTADEYGGGIYNYRSTPMVTNCIFWANGAPEGHGPEIFDGESSTTVVTYSDVQGDVVWPGQGNTNYNPSFVSPAEDDLRLRSCSPCVDAGNNYAPGLPATDLDGNPRFVDDEGLDDTGRGTGPVVDMGAYERQEHTTSFNVRNITQDVNYCSIQSAIFYAYPGDVIEVGPGTYDRFVLSPKAITIYSTHGPSVTFIDAGGYGSAVTCIGAGPSTVLEGFTITGGNATNGGGMFNSMSSLTVRNCTFTGNTATTDGGGMFNSYSSPTVTECSFIGNSADKGAGMYCDHSSPTVRNCTFTGNTASSGNRGGGGMFNSYSSPTVTNCIFAANSGDRGGGIYNDYSNETGSHAKVTNCTFTGNTATSGTQGGGGMFNYRSSPSVTNCVFSGNSAGGSGGGIRNRQDSAPTVTNCTFSGNSAGEYGGGMYNVDSSDPTVVNCIFWANTAETSAPQIYGCDPSVTYSDVEGGTGETWFGTGCIDADPLFVSPARGDLRLVSYQSPCVDAGHNSFATEPNDLAGNPRVWDGDEDGTARVDMGAYEFNGGPVRNLRLQGSYLSIQAAIDDAGTGDEIEAGPETYYEAINFKGKAIRLYSSSGPQVTTIDGGGAYHVVQCVSSEDANTILEGFTIRGGANGTRGGGMYCENSSPTVTNCMFSGNIATYGGGMFNWQSRPTVTNCNFIGNSAKYYGGGMNNQHSSSPTVTNCTFSNNSVEDDGGGMYNSSSSPTVTNCTFTGNTCSEYGGGIYNSSSSPTVTNCILWGDQPNEIVDDPCSTSVVTYSDVQGGCSGQGNIDENPLLRNVAEGDLSLVPWSPSIDTGNNVVVGPNATDITGLPRLVDGDCNTIVTVDMGAHEFRHDYGGDFDSSCLVNMTDFAVLAWAWLANPLSDNWDPVCNIGIPADGSIDNRDLKVLTGNWLRNVDTPITCEANGLKDEFGLDAVCAAAILTAPPCAYSPSDVAQALYDAGYSAVGAYQALTQVCGMTDGFPIEQLLYNVGYPPDEYLESTALSFVRKFAPVLYFDQVHKGLPMSAQVYFETMMSPQINSPYSGQITWTTPWNGPCGKPGVTWIVGRDESNCGMQNNDFTTLTNGQIPTYYKVISDIDSDIDTGAKGRLRIAYWWFYGFQKHCNPLTCDAIVPAGEHHGDWEFIWVTTDPDRSRADAVTYVFHGVWYTRKWGGFQTVGDSPVVYVGKLAHGNYHNDDHSGWMYGTSHHCCHYADYRDETEESRWYNTYDNLVSLRGSEPWMLADRIGSPYEYYGREYTISKWRWGPHISYKGAWCKWMHVYGCGTHPTINYPLDWDIDSCKAEGCRDHDCKGLVYTSPLPDYDQGWPWGGGFASTAVEYAKPAKPATPATYGSVASCSRCSASRFGAFVRLSDYWLATP